MKRYKKYETFAVSNLLKTFIDGNNSKSVAKINYSTIRQIITGYENEKYLEDGKVSIFYRKVIVPAIQEINEVGVFKVESITRFGNKGARIPKEWSFEIERLPFTNEQKHEIEYVDETINQLMSGAKPDNEIRGTRGIDGEEE